MKYSISAAAALFLVSLSANAAGLTAGKPALKADVHTALAMTQEIVAAQIKQSVRSLLSGLDATLSKIELSADRLVADEQSRQKAGDI